MSNIYIEGSIQTPHPNITYAVHGGGTVLVQHQLTRPGRQGIEDVVLEGPHREQVLAFQVGVVISVCTRI